MPAAFPAQKFLQQRIDLLRELSVAFGNDISRVVRGEPNLHTVIDIGPERVVIHFFRFYGHPGHKRKCFGEIPEFEPPVQGIIFFLPHMM